MKVVDINERLNNKAKQEFTKHFMDQFINELPYEMKMEIAKLARDNTSKFNESVLNFYLKFKAESVINTVH